MHVEEIFAEIYAKNAFREIDPNWFGIETTKVFRTASLRKLEAYPRGLSLLDKYKNIPKYIVFNDRDFLPNRNFVFQAFTTALILP